MSDPKFEPGAEPALPIPDGDGGTDLDVAVLPSFGFGHRSLMWWGTWGMIAIEGTVFALTIATYFYLRGQGTQWPIAEPPPDLLWGTLNVLVFLASAVPNQAAKRAAERYDLAGARRATLGCAALGMVLLILRVFEFRHLNCRWDTDAYGSVVWTLLGFHTAHLLTDWLDTAVLGVMLCTGPIEGKRYVDVSENAMYWYFVLASWLPIYGVIYWVPRLPPVLSP